MKKAVMIYGDLKLINPDCYNEKFEASYFESKSFSAAVSSIYVFKWHNCFEDPVTGLIMYLVRKL